MRSAFVIVCSASAVMIMAANRHVLWSGLRSGEFSAALLASISIVAIIACAWLLLVTLVYALNPELARRIAPGIVTAVLVAGVGLNSTPAFAESPLDGLRLPDRSEVHPPLADNPAGSSATTDHVAANDAVTSHVVASGESLWTIARSHLPPDASLAEIAEATQSWHQANRSSIGPDPNVIHPGQELNHPTSANQ